MPIDRVLNDADQQSGLTVAILIGLTWPSSFIAQSFRELAEGMWRRLRKSESVDWWFVVASRAKSSITEEQASELERLAVIKEGTGNLGAALLGLLVGIAIGLHDPHPASTWENRWAPMAAAGIAAIALLRRSGRAARDELAMQEEFGVPIKQNRNSTRRSKPRAARP